MLFWFQGIWTNVYIEFLKVGKLTYKFVCFSAVSTDETYPSSLAMGITNEQSQKKAQLLRRLWQWQQNKG